MLRGEEIADKYQRLTDAKYGSPEYVRLAKELGHGADDPDNQPNNEGTSDGSD